MFPLRDSVPSSRIPIVNYLLIAANTLVFLHQWSMPREALEEFIFRWAAVPIDYNPWQSPASVWIARAPNLFTSMFMHGGPGHLLGNMWFLYIFGDNVEDRLGHWQYFFFYVVCGLAAAFTQIVFSFNSGIPILGASGAIGGVMGAYMFAFSHSRVLTLIVFFFVRLVWIPAQFFLGLWFLLQALNAFGSLGQTGGGVAFFAHVGGFVAGMVMILVSRRHHPDRWEYEDDFGPRRPRIIVTRGRYR